MILETLPNARKNGQSQPPPWLLWLLGVRCWHLFLKSLVLEAISFLFDRNVTAFFFSISGYEYVPAIWYTYYGSVSFLSGPLFTEIEWISHRISIYIRRLSWLQVGKLVGRRENRGRRWDQIIPRRIGGCRKSERDYECQLNLHRGD